jgi:hypothetical protein
MSVCICLQVQFVLIFAHQFQILFYTDCNYPKGFMVWIGLHGVMFLFLFSDFYRTSYVKSEKPQNKNSGVCMVSTVKCCKKQQCQGNEAMKQSYLNIRHTRLKFIG